MLRRELGIAFCVCFGGVAILNARLLGMPPVWDAVGVFAPAVYLYESGFDVSGLLALPGYVAGGPNIHSLSLVTLLTLAAIELSGGRPTLFLPALHLANFAFAAVVGALAFSLGRRVLGAPVPAALLAAPVLLFPPFLVQSGALHTEMAGAALVMAGLVCFAAGRLGWTVACAVTACWVKSLGLVILAPLCVLIAADASLTRRRRWTVCGAMVVLGGLVEAAEWGAAPEAAGPGRSLAAHLGFVLAHLSQVPDLLALLGLSVAAGGAWLVRSFRDGLQPSLGDPAGRVRLATALVPAACLAFVAAVPLTGADFIPLQRYYVWVVAPAMIAVAGVLSGVVGPRVVSLLLAGFVVYAGLNGSGRFYPQSGETIQRFSVVERSHEYLHYYEAQRRGVEGLASIAADRPAFVTRGAYYFLSSPLMGWVDRHVRNVHFVLEPPYDASHLSRYPSDFYVLESDSNRYHGQGVVLDLVAQADRRSDYEARLAGEWTSGPYTSRLIHIRRTAAEGSEGSRPR